MAQYEASRLGGVTVASQSEIAGKAVFRVGGRTIGKEGIVSKARTRSGMEVAVEVMVMGWMDDLWLWSTEQSVFQRERYKDDLRGKVGCWQRG